MLSLHEGFLTIAMYHHRELPKYCNASSKRNNQIKLTHYDETKKKAHDSQIARAKENPKLSHGGPSHRQASDTNPPIKAFNANLININILSKR